MKPIVLWLSRTTGPTQSSDPRLKTTGRSIYIAGMLRRQIELPPRVAKAFVRNMQAFFRAKDQLKQDEIAAGTGWMLQQHLPRGAKLWLTDVKQMFLEMKDHV